MPEEGKGDQNEQDRGHSHQQLERKFCLPRLLTRCFIIACNPASGIVHNKL